MTNYTKTTKVISLTDIVSVYATNRFGTNYVRETRIPAVAGFAQELRSADLLSQGMLRER